MAIGKLHLYTVTCNKVKDAACVFMFQIWEGWDIM